MHDQGLVCSDGLTRSSSMLVLILRRALSESQSKAKLRGVCAELVTVDASLISICST